MAVKTMEWRLCLVVEWKGGDLSEKEKEIALKSENKKKSYRIKRKEKKKGQICNFNGS